MHDALDPDTSLTLTAACAEDFEQLLALRLDAMRESLERVGRFDPERSRQRFLANYAPQYTRHIEVFGVRVGFVAVKPDASGLHLDHLYVHPHHQGKGVGARVLRQVFAEADALGARLRVGALRGSDSNRFYQRHGFTFESDTEWDIYYVRAPHAAC